MRKGLQREEDEESCEASLRLIGPLLGSNLMRVTGTTIGAETGPEVLVELRRESGGLRGQVERGLREAIRARRLEPAVRLPASRILAADLGVSRRLVSDVYEQLRDEGWLQSRPGAGTWVAADATRYAAGALAPRPTEPHSARYDFFPGVPDLANFPRAAWSRALRDAVREAPDVALSYGDPRGPRELRLELAAYLRRARALHIDPNALVICSGAMQAISLLARVLVRSGSDRIAVEDPSLGVLTDALRHEGAQPVPVATDEEGLDVDALSSTRASAVIVTPAHQFPTGVPLSAARRARLVEWATDGRLILEDDYNAEFRYDRPALGSLQGLAPNRIAHIGTVSKTLAPGLRLGWLIPPAHLLGHVLEARTYADGGPPVIDCLALSRMLSSGDYDRHLRASRRRYRARRAALEGAIARELPDCCLTGVPGGLHAPVRLPVVMDAPALVQAALDHDIAVYPLSWFQSKRPASTDTLVLGYGNLSELAIAEGIRRLGQAMSTIAT